MQSLMIPERVEAVQANAATERAEHQQSKDSILGSFF
jgi:hypothetical protein